MDLVIFDSAYLQTMFQTIRYNLGTGFTVALWILFGVVGLSFALRAVKRFLKGGGLA